MHKLTVMAASSFFAWCTHATVALASVYNGSGVPGGVGAAAGINTGGSGDARTIVLQTLQSVLLLMGLAAVASLIGAGIFMLMGGISDTNRERAQKIITFSLAGLIIIVIAGAYVRFLITSAS